MEKDKTMLDKIIRNNQRLHTQPVKRLLLLHEENITLIGDFCVRFDKLSYMKAFFNNPVIEINFSPDCKQLIYQALLANNPHIHSVTTLSWVDIDFAAYDMVICATYTESVLLHHLEEGYKDLLNSGDLNTAVFSLSAILLGPHEQPDFVLPPHQQLLDYIMIPRPGEIYVSPAEQQWAITWLQTNGLKPAEELCILLDSTSRRDKLINLDVYFAFLTEILSLENIRVLIFDENAIGKSDFYTSWLGVELAQKMIFSQSLSLREVMCLLAAPPVKLIFGPCTGLMHCASGIYNHFVNNGMHHADVPLMITYTGKYLPGENNAQSWWGGAPLINCLLLKKRGGQKMLLTLSGLTKAEQQTDDSLACSEYTADMLIDFVKKKKLLREEAESITITI